MQERSTRSSIMSVTTLLPYQVISRCQCNAQVLSVLGWEGWRLQCASCDVFFFGMCWSEPLRMWSVNRFACGLCLRGHSSSKFASIFFSLWLMVAAQPSMEILI